MTYKLLPSALLSSQGYGFPSGHVWMWGLYCEESWAPKNWCFWTVVSEKTLESPLDCKEVQPVHSEGDQAWVFFGRTDAKAETPVLWPPHAKSWLIGKDSDAGRDWQQEEKGMTEDEMAGWHHWLDGRESEWTLEVGDGQGGLVCWDSRGHKDLDTTEQLNWTEWYFISRIKLCAFYEFFLYFDSVQFRSVAQSRPTLWPHESQHSRPPCPSPSPRVHSNSSPSSWWCHPAISSSIVPFSSCPQSFPASGSFPMSQLFTSGGQILEFQLQH